MSILFKFLDHFFLLRPTLFFPLWTILLAGRYNSGSDAPLVLLFIGFGALMGSAYAVNQIVDEDGDRRNQKLFLISEGHVSRGSAIVLAVLLAFAGIAGLFSLGTIFGLTGLVFIIITGVFYNLDPFRWKDKPLENIIVTIIGGALAFFLGGLPHFNLILLWKCLPYIFALGAVAALTAIPDMKGDEETGKETFALKYGIGPTLILSALLCVLAAVTGWWTQDRLIFWPAVLSAPVFIYAAVKRDKNAAVLAVKVSIFLLSLTVGLRYLGYLLLMGIYYLFARWYYRERFNLEYPSFKTESLHKNIPD